MKGRKPIMCVTGLQSHPSVSIGCSAHFHPVGPVLLQPVRQLLERFRVYRPCLRIVRPRQPAHCVECETQPPGFIRFRFSSVRLVYHLRIHADCSDTPVGIHKSINVCRWNSGRLLVLTEPLVDDLRNLRVLANKNKDRRSWIVLTLFPFAA